MEKSPTSDRFCVVLSPKCNISCKHCLCADYKVPPLSKNDFKYILHTLIVTKTTSIRITGGEPTLNLPLIEDLTNFIKADIPDIKVEILTNSLFATSLDACKKVLGKLSRLNMVCVSYDRFHAEHVPLSNIRTLITYCSKNDIAISGFATITSPLDLTDILNYEKELGITFYYQRVLPIGNAKINKVEYTYDYFEFEVLQKKCPQLASLVYIPSRGVTHCCSLLILQIQEVLLRKVTNRNVLLYRQSKFYRLMSTHTMGELVTLAGKKPVNLTPESSNICELCQSIVPSLLGEVYD